MCVCVQTLQDKLSKCDELLNDIQDSVAGEKNIAADDSELSRVRRRYTNLSEKISKHCERVNCAAQLRESYWRRRSSLETCLENCRREMSSLDSDNIDVDGKVEQLEASYCSLVLSFFAKT